MSHAGGWWGPLPLVQKGHTVHAVDAVDTVDAVDAGTQGTSGSTFTE